MPFQEHLGGAVVCPSDEDSRTFTISCASGDILKLRAINARARQEWVDGLRNVAECHTQSIGSQFEMLPLRDAVAASDAFGEARQQLHNTELWYVNLDVAPSVCLLIKPYSNFLPFKFVAMQLWLVQLKMQLFPWSPPIQIYCY